MIGHHVGPAAAHVGKLAKGHEDSSFLLKWRFLPLSARLREGDEPPPPTRHSSESWNLPSSKAKRFQLSLE
jgi:hypothetical protein